MMMKTFQMRKKVYKKMNTITELMLDMRLEMIMVIIPMKMMLLLTKKKQLVLQKNLMRKV